jgi:hypothetical protein
MFKKIIPMMINQLKKLKISNFKKKNFIYKKIFNDKTTMNLKIIIIIMKLRTKKIMKKYLVDN